MRRLPPRVDCERCHDSGLVLLDSHMADPDSPDGFRREAFAYRCECAAGAPFKKFPLAPPAGPRQMPLPRKDIDG